MNGSQIKMVVWDLDDTFWAGTLSEGGGRVKAENVAILRALVDRGIMNSICSKNDFDAAKARLKEIGVWDLFVFPRINWQPKGAQIAELIDSCRLRPVNVLFVDDSPANLQEAVFFSPGLQTATPEILPRLLEMPAARGREDLSHVRLGQFKLLERKQEARKSFSTNDAFLRKSNIRVVLDEDCLARADRIQELIERTNQLNFTKRRIGRDELIALLHDQSARNFVVSVKDAYGDYGVAGFVSIRNGACEHFLFSCRVLGLGVEQWVYSTLGYPQIAVVGETACTLSPTERPDWINRGNPGGQADGKVPHVGLRVLMRGGCDLRQMEQYLDFERLDCEFNYLRYHRDHTVFAVDVLSRSPFLAEIAKKVPFLWRDTFDTAIYDGNHDVVVFSVLIDYIQAVYQFDADASVRIAHGGWMRPLSTTYTSSHSLEDLDWFFRHFTCTGCISPEEFRNDLETMRAHIPAGVHLVLINGCEVPHENPDEPGMFECHVALNKVVDEFVAAHGENTHLLDMRRLVTHRGQLTNNIRHYTRDVYHDMAMKLMEIAAEIEAREPLAAVRWLRRAVWKVRRSFAIVVGKDDGVAAKEDGRNANG